MVVSKSSPRVRLAIAYLEYHLSEALMAEEIVDSVEFESEFTIRRSGVGSTPHNETFTFRIEIKKT